MDVYFARTGEYQLINTQSFQTTSLTNFLVKEGNHIDQSTEFMNLEPNLSVVADIDRFRSYFDKSIDKSITLDMTMMMDHDAMGM